MSEDAAIVLAAGKGTRMHSSLPKVLHRLAGKPMLTRVLDSLAQIGFTRPVVVVGYGQDQIRAVVGDRCRYVDQDQQLGTGHAARVGLTALPAETRSVLIVHGDEPLIERDLYQQMLVLQSAEGVPIVLLTAQVTDTREFGRVVRDDRNRPVALVQQDDLTPEQRELREVNLGAYVFDADFLRRHLPELEAHPPKGEFYLTDLIALAAREGTPPAAVQIANGDDVMGVNDLVQLEQAGRNLYRATNRRLMHAGVTIIDSAGTFIEDDVEISPDTIIHPFTIITGHTRIGSGCAIGPSTQISASRIGDRCTVTSSVIEDASVADDVRIGPYAHLRPGTQVGSGAEIGNYAEIKQSIIGPGTKMHHMSYIGDAQIGRNVNISAGVITCNYDGRTKHQTVIEDDAFVGCDTMLRAPIRIGTGAYTGAGAVVTHDVPAGVTVAGVPARILRSHQPAGEAGADESSEDAEEESSKRGA